MTSVHGHRGCRGLLPENTVAGFIRAVELGATALEMDLVISADRQIVVSHEPWMDHRICLAPDGSRIPETGQKSHNIYRMPYAQVKLYDCGRLKHPDFPLQTPVPAHKPLLSEVVQAVEGLAFPDRNPPVLYNLEVKSSPAEDHLFQPVPEVFTRLILDELQLLQVPDNRLLVQSFDSRILEEFHRQAPRLALGFLVEKGQPIQRLAELSFRPQYLNPHHSMVNPELMSHCRTHGIQVIPWTVNEKPAMHRLLDLGVAGLISDYPGRVVEALNDRADADEQKEV